MNACTIIAKNFLPYARVLADSFYEHHPDGTFTTLVVDEYEGLVDPAAERFEVIQTRDLGIEEFQRMAVGYTVLELCTAVKPWLLRYLLEQRDMDHVAYLDPDIRIYRPLDEIERLTREHELVLIPHEAEPMPRDGRKPSEGDIMIAGMFNLGFVSVARGEQTGRLLDWWSERLVTDCRSDPENGYFVDQRWMDFVPGMFERYFVLRDPTYNVAYWNLDRLDFDRDGSGYRVNGAPLHFFHFSGFDARKPELLSKYQDRILLSDHPVLARMCGEYAGALLAAGFEQAAGWPYSYARLGNGLPLEDDVRHAYGRAADRGERFGDVFQPEGAEAFTAWLNQPEQPGAAAGVTRYLHEVYRSRPDLQQGYPDLNRDGNGFVAWAEVFGGEVPIPPQLAPAAGAAGPAAAGEAAADRPRGVNVAGFYRSELGVGEAARQIVAALDAEHVPVAQVGLVAPHSRQGHDYAHTGANIHPFPINVICVNADGTPGFRQAMGEEFFRGRYSVGMWWWEVADFPDRFAPAFDVVDEVWAGSRHVADAIAAKSPVPVVKVTIPVEMPEPVPVARAELGLPEGFCFLLSYDYHSVLERKNPLGLIEAFKRAFEPGEGPTLVLKSINGDRHLDALERVRMAAGERPDILVTDGYLSVEQKNGLTASCDCTVSLHRSEGFGFTLAEAMLLGRPVIATGYSGNLDFMNEGNSWLVGYELVPIGEGADPYPPDGVWAEPDLDHAAALMRAVVERPEEARARAERGAREIRETHSAQAAGRAMAARLGEIERRLDAGGRHPEYGSSQPVPVAELIEDGPGARESTRGPVGRLLRKAVLRLMRPYAAYQRDVDRALLDYLRRRDMTQVETVSAFRTRMGQIDRMNDVAEQLKRRADELSSAAETLRRRPGPAPPGPRRESRPIGDDVRERYPPPARPWNWEYQDLHRSLVADALDDPAFVARVGAGEALPDGYGVGFDERVIELPWVAAQELGGRLLDAGSALNHEHLLDRFRPRVGELAIVTRDPEQYAFPERDVSYVFCDLRELPFRDGLFDVVASISTLEHVGMDNARFGAEGLEREGDPREEMRRALGELRRAVAPGGRLLVTVPYGRREDHGWLRQFDRAEVEELIAAAGAQAAHVQVFRYDAERGWQPSDLEAAAGERYRDFTQNTSPAEDLAAAARAVACVRLEY